MSPAALQSISLRPIGVVESSFASVDAHYSYEAEAHIRLRDDLLPGLSGIEYFSHLWVIYHQHKSAEWMKAKGVAPDQALYMPADDERAGQGVYSSRAPCRPSALGSCIVKLLRREGARLTVTGLDAIDGTPVLDVKIYVPQFDAFPDAVVPKRWARVMNDEDDLSLCSREFHWDTTAADFALGLRAGARLLAQLHCPREAARSALVEGSLFFAQGFEAATGCSPLRGTLGWTESTAYRAPWTATLQTEQGSARISINNLHLKDASAVLAANEADLAWTLLPQDQPGVPT